MKKHSKYLEKIVRNQRIVHSPTTNGGHFGSISVENASSSIVAVRLNLTCWLACAKTIFWLQICNNFCIHFLFSNTSNHVEATNEHFRSFYCQVQLKQKHFQRSLNQNALHLRLENGRCVDFWRFSQDISNAFSVL